MLNLFGTRRTRNYCDRINRRDFVKVGSLGLAGLGLPELLRGQAAAPNSPKDTSVVLLWLDGGPTQIETWDPKMDVPVEFRTLVGAVQTKLPGVSFGGLFPKLGGVADKMAIVRSFHTGADDSHPGGCHAVKTGYPFPPGIKPAFETQVRPSMGAIVSRVRGANHPRTGVPSFLETDYANGRRFGVAHSGPMYLGREYGPFQIKQKNALDDMVLNLRPEALHDRRELLDSFDKINRAVDQSGVLRSMDGFQQQAINVLTAGKVKEAFDLQREDNKVRDRYGKGLGEHLLLARRLCESGASFVTVYFGDWDMHSNFGPMTRGLNNLLPQVDHAASAFVDDIHQRGLDRNILFIITGEMGRTARIGGYGTNSFGREHWPHLCSLALSGGGFKMGQVIGESTSKSELPKSQPYSPQDLMATIFHHMGIDQEIQFKDLAGRPVTMNENGKPIVELL